MKVILNQDVYNLGSVGDIVRVRDGYARNFLLPRNLAMLANEGNKTALDHHMRVMDKKRAKLLGEAKKLASLIEKTSVRVVKQVGEDEKIFGSVTTAELEELLHAEGFKTVNRKDIAIEGEVKKVGSHVAKVRLHSDVSAKLKFWVSSEK